MVVKGSSAAYVCFFQEETLGIRWSGYKILRPVSLRDSWKVKVSLVLIMAVNRFTVGGCTSWALYSVLSGYPRTEGLSPMIS